MTHDDDPTRGRRHPLARILLAVYAVTLALIVFWPAPVDQGAGPLLRLITRLVPALTYARIEFRANIALFVPLGVLLAIVMRRWSLIVPIAIVTTLFIESVQGLFLAHRVPSVLDIVANTAGACVGLLLVAAVTWLRERRESAGLR